MQGALVSNSSKHAPLFLVLLWSILPVLGTSKLQEMQRFCSFMRLDGQQLGRHLECFKLQILSLLPPDLKKPYSNNMPVAHSSGKNNNILYLFFLNRFRVSRSMDYHHNHWLLVRKIIYNKYCSCLQQTCNVYSSFINRV